MKIRPNPEPIGQKVWFPDQGPELSNFFSQQIKILGVCPINSYILHSMIVLIQDINFILHFKKKKIKHELATWIKITPKCHMDLQHDNKKKEEEKRGIYNIHAMSCICRQHGAKI